MHDHSDHKGLIKSLAGEYAELLGNSEQAIYIYLDDELKVCNKKFATLLGYKSEAEWAEVTESFPEAFVEKEDRETLVDAYQNAMEKGVGSHFELKWTKKEGGSASTSVILVPIVFQGHLFALHFVSAN